MNLDLDKIKAVLYSPEYSAYQIEKESEVSRATVSNLRRGKQQFGRLRIDTVLKLQKWLEDRRHEENKEKLDQDGHTTSAEEILHLTVCEPALDRRAHV